MKIEQSINKYLDEESSLELYKILNNMDKFNLTFKSKINNLEKQIQKCKDLDKKNTNNILKLLQQSFNNFDKANKEINDAFKKL